ncbi:MAG: chromosome segregation protein SMC [Deltaproteobacteria bacterium]|nr:chromosome segregation protein SMC [Deltaproteobacteria bacterium]
MRLKRLEIIGFKSFMDRTVLRFDDGVTGVVGPNGCGKSNIVDAIRWVLGEQSAKHLRGGNMADVIFNGSQARPPAGMAEVTLTFKNDTPEEVPTRYRSFAEIAITRRLFRTGESEYLINKQPCRLLDITELFLGTGMGTKAYSIIEQGRIGLIVSAKPDDRRAIIEEAAGITRFKAKRKAAERKMEATQQNLLRVGDLVAELGSRLNSLNRQAKKAERYKAYKAELRDIEVHLTSHRWLEVRAEREALRLQEQTAHLHLDDDAEQIHTSQAALAEAREAMTADEARLAALQEQAARAEGDVRLHEERLQNLEREKESLGTRAVESREEIAHLEERLTELKAKLEELAAERGELEAVLTADKEVLDGRQQQTTRHREELAGLTERLETQRTAALEAVRLLSQGKTHLEGLAKQRADLEARQERAREERETSRARIEELQVHQSALGEKLEGTRQLQLQLEDRRQATSVELDLVRGKIASLEAELGSLRDVLADKRARHESIVAIQQSYEGYEPAVQTVMLHRDEAEGLAEDAVAGLLADVIQSQPEFEVALEAALGDRLQHILVRSREAGLTLVNFLKDRTGGRGGFVPMDDLRPHTDADPSSLLGKPGIIGPAREAVKVEPGFEEIVDHLMAGIVLVDSLEEAFALWPELKPGLRLVTRDGTVLTGEGVILGGESEKTGMHLLELRRETAELASAISNLTADLERNKAERDRLVNHQRSLEEAVRDLSKSSHSEQIEIVSQEKEQHRLTDELERLTERLSLATHESESLKATLKEIDQEVKRTHERLSTTEHEQTDRERKVEELGRARDEAEAHLTEEQSEVTRLRVKNAADAERHEALGKEIAHLERTANEQRERLASLQGWLGGSAERAEKILEGMNEARVAAARAREEGQSLRQGLEQGRAELARSIEVLKEREAALEQLREGREARSTEYQDLQMAGREHEIELRNLAERLRERHDLSVGEALHLWHHHRMPDETDAEQAAALRSKIEKMGEVNLTALSEFEEISERHTFLSAQKADLDASLERLAKAITKINRTSKRRFVETFEAVNVRFQKIFPRMFNGGKAGLVLLDPSDPLRSGVDIHAQPPGKKLQSVTLLSGGEKALTAISLIFAIFLVRPTPFCLLDEVDAPLDDHNVGRYNQTVAEMAQRSQFVLITHNKVTMEITDTLYGITMEEPGVSKLVSVNLKAAEAATATAAA